jgi:hypothetical protein
MEKMYASPPVFEQIRAFPDRMILGAKGAMAVFCLQDDIPDPFGE